METLGFAITLLILSAIMIAVCSLSMNCFTSNTQTSSPNYYFTISMIAISALAFLLACGMIYIASRTKGVPKGNPLLQKASRSNKGISVVMMLFGILFVAAAAVGIDCFQSTTCAVCANPSADTTSVQIQFAVLLTGVVAGVLTIVLSIMSIAKSR